MELLLSCRYVCFFYAVTVMLIYALLFFLSLLCRYVCNSVTAMQVSGSKLGGQRGQNRRPRAPKIRSIWVPGRSGTESP